MLHKPALGVAGVELNTLRACCSHTREMDAEEGNGAQRSPRCPPGPHPHDPPSALDGGKPSPAPLYAPSQAVFSCLALFLSPVAEGPKPASAEDALVFVFAAPMWLYICFCFHHSHLLQVVPGILYPVHRSVTVNESDEHRSISLLLTLCLSSLLLTSESLSLLPASPTSCPAVCMCCGALLRWCAEEKKKKEIWGKEWILARVTVKSETLVWCQCLQDRALQS